MIFGLEGAVDFSGKARNGDDKGYPHTVVAQPHEIPGKDRYSAEIYALTQETIQQMDDGGSVCYHPLKRLIATTWAKQGLAPLEKQKKRIRALANYASFK